METKKGRVEYVDIAKGIGIICIILGHLGVNTINRVVFTFHVPIFFLITGYFTNSNRSMKEFVKNKIKTLLVPYFLTSLMIIGLGTLKGFVEGNVKTNFLIWTYAALYGAGDSYTEPFYIKGIGAIWFLWASFWGSVFLRASLKFDKWVRLAIIMILFVLGYESRKWFWFPLSIQAGACATLFMYIGYLFSKSKDELKKIPSEIKIFCAIFAFGIWVSFIVQFQSFWLVHCDMGRGIIDVFGAVCACACVLLFSWMLDQKGILIAKPLGFLGKYSLFVLCIHITELNLFPWWRIAEKVSGYGMSSECQFLSVVIGKLMLDLGGAWIFSKIKFIKKMFGMK